MDYRTVFIASDRTDYFDICLGSLKPQVEHNPKLYLDGSLDNPAVQQNLDSFKQHFPLGEVVHVEYGFPDYTIARIFVDHFDTPYTENLFLVEDDLLFSHNYIKQSKIVHDHIKDNPEVVCFSCFSRATLDWPLECLVRRKSHLVQQHNHIGTIVRMPLFQKIAERHMRHYYEQLEEKEFVPAMEALKDYYSREFNKPPIGRIKVGIDTFYCQGVIPKYTKWRVSTAYNKLIHMGINGCNTDIASYYHAMWHKVNYIEDLVTEFSLQTGGFEHGI